MGGLTRVERAFDKAEDIHDLLAILQRHIVELKGKAGARTAAHNGAANL